MVNWKVVATKVGLTLAIIFAAGSLVGAVAKHFYDQKVQNVLAEADSAQARAGRQVMRAHAAQILAESKAKQAAAHAKAAQKFDSVAAVAPDTCKQVVIEAKAAIQNVTDAYKEQMEATAALQGALQATTDTLTDARKTISDLKTVVKPNIWARLKPTVRVTVGPQVGIDTHGHAYGGAGVTLGLSWGF
jgi:hypothetical protein